MSKYKATIHTLTIEPTPKTPVGLSTDRYQEHIRQWARELDHHKPSWCRSVKRDNNDPVRLTINPHRLNESGSGKYLFEHIPLSEYHKRMETICTEGQIEPDYIIRRVDICLDTDHPYTDTQKLTRLILLMLAQDNGLDNRYMSIDPLTLEPKAITLANGKKKNKTLEIEHYNRALIDQTDSENEPIRNRIEFRTMGRQAGADRTEESIGKGWFERLRALQQADITTITDTLNTYIMNGWKLYKVTHGKDNTYAFHGYLRTVEPHIYTQQQAAALFGMYGHERPSKALNNFMSKNGEPLILFNRADILIEIVEMMDALNRFLKN